MPSDLATAWGLTMPTNYADLRFASDLPPLTPEQKRLVEEFVARPPIGDFWNPLAHRAVMTAFVRNGIDPDDTESVMAAMTKADRNIAPVLPIDNRTPYFPATKPWAHECTAAIRDRVALTVRVLGDRALILTEKMALYVGDFANYMRDDGIESYFDEVGTVSIGASLMVFVEGQCEPEASKLICGIVRREYGEFRPVYRAKVAEFRGGARAVDQPEIRELIEKRRSAHSAFDRYFAALKCDLSGTLEKYLRQHYPW
mgnify:CR=1 FL=1